MGVVTSDGRRRQRVLRARCSRSRGDVIRVGTLENAKTAITEIRARNSDGKINMHALRTVGNLELDVTAHSVGPYKRAASGGEIEWSGINGDELIIGSFCVGFSVSQISTPRNPLGRNQNGNRGISNAFPRASGIILLSPPRPANEGIVLQSAPRPTAAIGGAAEGLAAIYRL